MTLAGLGPAGLRGAEQYDHPPGRTCDPAFGYGTDPGLLRRIPAGKGRGQGAGIPAEYEGAAVPETQPEPAGSGVRLL